MTGVRPLTIRDLEMFYMGLSGHPFVDFADVVEIMKAAGEISTGLGTAIYNQVYGAYVWAQINQEANVFGMLPKTTWPRSGWRVKTGLSTTENTLGISETSALPSAVRPEIATVKANPKVQVITFEVSDVVEALVEVGLDDVWGSVNQVRAEMGVEFAKLLNKQLLKDIETPAGYMFESVDRVCGSADELDSQGKDPALANIYGINRQTNTWANAQVLHNSGTLRDLTDELIRELLNECKKAGANTNVILTGPDTYAKIQGIYMNFIRYLPMSETKVQFGINGIQSAEGLDAGIRVAALYGLPLIRSVDVPKDGDGIHRIYALDTSDPEGYGLPRMAISVLRPVEYFETRDFLLLNKFVIKGAYRIVGELVCRTLPYQGKLRDLQ